jgi:hypothetical protein
LYIKNLNFLNGQWCAAIAIRWSGGGKSDGSPTWHAETITGTGDIGGPLP